MEQAVREHFARHPPRRPLGPEIRRTYRTLDALATPRARDGHARTPPLSADPEETGGKHTRRTHPETELPEDPETIYLHLEALARFRNTLSPLEQAVFDLPFSESDAVVASTVGTTAKTVKTTRQRIRAKARRWAAVQVEAESEDVGEQLLVQRTESEDVKGARGGHACGAGVPVRRNTKMQKHWECTNEMLALIRPMMADEVSDMLAGYPASRYRRRAMLTREPSSLQVLVANPVDERSAA
jgi:hypothetical protein